MASPLAPLVRQHLTALRMLLLMTAVLGLAYPLAVTVIGQVAFPGRADGSMVSHDGVVVGSSLIGQSFADADGAALPEWFQSRPSAGGYDPLASGASNLGPENPDLIEAIKDRRAQVADLDGVRPDRVPPDAVTASGSGLDPDISPAYAYLQVNRVAAARGLDVAEVRALVTDHVEGRELGVIGAPHVNVLLLNLAVDELSG